MKTIEVSFTKAQLDALLWLIRLVPLRCKPIEKDHPLFKAQGKVKLAAKRLAKIEETEEVADE